MDNAGQGPPADRLTPYLRDVLNEPISDIDVLASGLNRIVRVSTDSVDYIVRHPRKSREEAGFVDIATEHAILERLDPTSVPTPRPIHFCSDKSILGAPFSVTEAVPGEPLEWDSPFPPGHRSRDSRRRYGRILIDTLAELHALDPARFDGVCETVGPQTHVDRTIEQFQSATDRTGHEPIILRRVADWLQANVPDAEQAALTHGDYKPDNVFCEWTDEPRMTAVLDWETAKRRDPRTELGYLFFFWRDADDPSPSLEGIERRHSAATISSVRDREQTGFWPFPKRPGAPSRLELAERWERKTGLSYDHDRFYRAFGAFMLATVWEGLYADGLENGEETGDWEGHIEYVGVLADAIIDGDFTL